MITAASQSSALPWIFSVGAASVAILTGVVKAGRWAASVQDQLRQQQKDLSRLGKAVAALERDRDNH